MKIGGVHSGSGVRGIASAGVIKALKNTVLRCRKYLTWAQEQE